MSKNFKKIEIWLFYLFLFSIPISFRHIFGYQEFQFVEWRSIYVYATDIILIVLFGIYLWERSRSHKANVRSRVGEIEHKSQQAFDAVSRWLRLSWRDIFLLAFLAAAAFSIHNAIDVRVAWFAWLKLLEGVALYFYIKNYALKKFEISKGFVALVLGAIFQSVIAIAQFAMQGSLGLKYLGESVLNPAMTGIAAFYVHGIKIIRAYGTTPHSNVLAVYLFIAIGAFYSIAIYQKRNWWWFAGHALMLWAFFLTFSRTIIGLWAINFVIRAFLIRFHKPFRTEFWENPTMRARSLKIFWTTIAVAAAFLVVYWPYVASRSTLSDTDEAVQLRVFYNHESLVSARNWFGLGMGNFVPWLETQGLHIAPDLYQPTHNVYLLIYSETGIIGISLFILFLTFLLYDFYRRLGFKKLYHFSFSLVILSVLIMGLFDHYLWTIQAGRLVFWLVLALAAGAE